MRENLERALYSIELLRDDLEFSRVERVLNLAGEGRPVVGFLKGLAGSLEGKRIELSEKKKRKETRNL